MAHFPLRTDLDFPKPFKSEKMPRDTGDLSKQIANRIHIDDRILSLLGKSGARITVHAEDLHSGSHTTERERVAYSSLNLRQRASHSFRFNDHIDERVLKLRLKERLREEVEKRALDGDDEKTLRRVVDYFLATKPKAIKDACREALANHVELADADPLPESILEPAASKTAEKALYGIFPNDLNTWERAFAEWMENDTRDIIAWWHRNPPNLPYSVAIVRPNGRRFFPDFVVGVNITGEIKTKLVEIKREIDSTDSREKIRTDHRAYGMARMLFRDVSNNEWFEVSLHVGTMRQQLADKPFDLADLVWANAL